MHCPNCRVNITLFPDAAPNRVARASMDVHEHITKSREEADVGIEDGFAFSTP